MKYLILLSALIVLSCSKKEECNSDTLAHAIIGKWNVIAYSQIKGNVEFRSDGTLVDTEDLLVSGEIGDVVLDFKSFEVPSDGLIRITAAKGEFSVEYDLEILSYSCDEIQVPLWGMSVLERE